MVSTNQFFTHYAPRSLTTEVEGIVHPIVFRVGPFAVRFYGLMYVTALLVGIWLLRMEAKRRGLPPERMVDLAFYAFVGA